jgi:O-antigen ligase
MAAALFAAVLLRGGTLPNQWEWCALAGAAGSLLWLLPGKERPPGSSHELAITAALLAWMIIQLVPLPPALIARLSPGHAGAVAAARAATGQPPGAWIPLTLAPPSTFERLLDVIPAMAVFAAAREMGWRWRDRMWIAAAPVVGVAWVESALGLAQFALMRQTGGAAGSVSGTYVNHNHFAGLLEIAFPLAIMGALSAWRKQEGPEPQALAPALQAAAWLAIAACLLAGVVVSLSRMGFFSAVAAGGAALFLLLKPARTAMRWAVPAAAALLILVLLPTRELSQRIEQIPAAQLASRNVRLEIWRDTLPLIAAYKWTGCGLGAYERGLYKFKTAAPVNTVDFAHNDYMQVVAELGLPGGLLAGALAVTIFSKPLMVALKKRDAANWELAAGLAAALLAFGVHSLADFNLYIPANAMALAWVAGLAASPGLRAA